MLWVGAGAVDPGDPRLRLQRWKYEQDLRMTHQEVREEMKNLQGDPQIVARRRAIQRQMVLNRIASSVPKADVVVTNPTELAVAIQYDPEEMAAPVVVAKGAGVLAQRIRRLALENNIPDRRAQAARPAALQGSRHRQADSDRVVRRRGRSAGVRLPAQGQEAADAARRRNGSRRHAPCKAAWPTSEHVSNDFGQYHGDIRRRGREFQAHCYGTPTSDIRG